MLRSAMGDPGARAYIKRAAAELRTFFERIDDVALFPEDVDDIRQEILARVDEAKHEFGSETGDALVARAMADAIDLAFGPRLVDCFRGRGSRALHPGDPFPIAAPPLLAVFGKQRLGTKPESRGPPLDDATNLRILRPPVRGHRVTLSTDHADILARLAVADAEVAVIWATALADLEYDTEERGGEMWFHSVRPRDSAGATQAVIQQLQDLAESEGPLIGILPELSLGPDGLRR